MIEPASTIPAPADLAVARGVVTSVEEESLVLHFPGTEYNITLCTTSTIKAKVGDTIEGTITCQANRMDRIRSGGRYIEPIEGRPRRVQGRIVSIDERNNTVTVHAGVPMTITPHKLQKASEFELDQLVTMGILDGSSFEHNQ